MLGVRMNKDVNYNNLINIYDNEISKNIKNKKKLVAFEINKMQYISNIIKMLLNGEVGHHLYNIFIIYEPKCRLVMSLPVKDKLINHFVCKYYLENNLNKYLDIRNCATRKNMGTSYAIKLLKKYLEINKRKYKDNFYILKIDLKKYFYNIDHEILKSLLIDKLDNYEYKIISKIIDSTNDTYINKKIEYYINNKNKDIPLYKKGKGLPIGNMTSQFLSIYYLYKLDHYIVHDLKLKYYIRYMDDFIIISNDLNKLKKAKDIITNKLKEEYKIDINEKKTMITKVNHYFSFLGYSFKIRNNKTIIKVREESLNKIKKKIKLLSYQLKIDKISYNKAFASIMTYENIYPYCNNRKIIDIINKYFYEK